MESEKKVVNEEKPLIDSEKKVVSRVGLSLKLILIVNGIVFVSFLIFGLYAAETATKITTSLAKKGLYDITESTLNLAKSTVDSAIRNYLRGIAEKNKDSVNELYNQYRMSVVSGYDSKKIFSYNGAILNNSRNIFLFETEAKNLARNLLLSQKIGETGYIYCINSDGMVKVHPKLPHNFDASLFSFVKKQIVEKNGYIEYDWKNPGEYFERPKVLYMEYFEPWDWIISVSSYRSEFLSLVDIKQLKERILSIKIGETGYVAVMNSKADILIHPFLEGINVMDSKDSSGRYFIKEMAEKKNGEITYPWQNKGESRPREKISIFKYYPEMDWFILAGVYVDELYVEAQNLKHKLQITTIIVLMTVVSISTLAGLRLFKIEQANKQLEADIEKRNRELEQQRLHIIESEKMASLGQIVAGVAHEINTPLGAGISSASYIEKINNECRLKLSQGRMTKDDLKNFMESVDDTIQILNHNLTRAAELVRSFKQIAIDQSGRVFEKFNLKDYINIILLSLRHEYKNKNVEFTVDCDQEIVLESFPGDYSQIFTNLIMNSLIHGFKEKKEEKGKIKIDCEITGGVLHINYTDNGKGIGQEHITRIFEPFFTTNRASGGSGLGLSVIYNIVTQKLKGRIRCESVLEESTTFFLELPIHF
ncbi:MAG: cache domain-containing protein [Desulfamplus sp.]|nr:cache domain-containing protein [Desulfamplus sp.]